MVGTGAKMPVEWPCERQLETSVGLPGIPPLKG
jgi:hypothetical protein